MIIWILIEARRKTGRVEGALVFAKAPSSLVPKPKQSSLVMKGRCP